MALAVDEHERRCLELAWRSCRSGTVGVGAVLLDAEGDVIAEGNNAIFAAADAGPLVASRIAHAEMNVFAQVTPDRRGATLYTSLEPCPMCAGAIILHDLQEVRVLAPDYLMHGLEAMGDRNEWIRNRFASRSFAADPDVIRLATLLASHSFFYWFDEGHNARAAIAAAVPKTARWISDIVAAGTLIELAEAQASLDDVIATVLA